MIEVASNESRVKDAVGSRRWMRELQAASRKPDKAA